MIFSSIPFLFFFFVYFLILYFLVPKKFKNLVLLIFSLIFYAWGEPVYIVLMIFSSAFNYMMGLSLEKKAKDKKLCKKLLVISILVNLLLLGFFKYVDFLIDIVNNLLNLDISYLNLGLPIGISFFTFQTMSYTIDVYRKDVKASHNFLDFTTYVSMFPQLIAGPIVRYETVNEELQNREHSFSKFSSGLLRFMRGLFKKVLLANNIGLLFTLISNLGNNELSVLLAWLGAISYMLQIYFDFSGYSDMAIGMGKMLGFNYLENFNYPYIATSITDFWRRWHISLSSWFKDYLYIPLGGNRVSKIINIRNILIVWMLTGLWHGANYNFIIWGLYYGIILILEKYFLKNILDKLPKALRHIYTLVIVLISWVIFAFDDITILTYYMKTLFGLTKAPFINSNFLYYFSNYFIILLLGAIFSTPIYPSLMEKLKNTKRKNLVFFITLFIYIILFVITVSYLVSDTYNPFLYFRF